MAIPSVGIVAMSAGMAAAADDARMRQLRLLCAQLSGDLTADTIFVLGKDGRLWRDNGGPSCLVQPCAGDPHVLFG